MITFPVDRQLKRKSLQYVYNYMESHKLQTDPWPHSACAPTEQLKAVVYFDTQ